MKLQGFRIENFKGVKRADIRFAEHDVARVHTLVGLNESGKTTILEAMHSFSPDAETERVVKNVKSIKEQRAQWVPRDQIARFTGAVKVTGFVKATEDDWRDFNDMLEREYDISLKIDELPAEFPLELAHEYNKGDYVKSELRAPITPKVKTLRARKFRDSEKEEAETIFAEIKAKLPTIAYYPTFVFDFPERIYLTARDQTARNAFYRQLFQDILDYDGSGFTIEESINSRLHKADTEGHWEKWFSAFVGTSEEEKVKQVIARAEKAVTEVVFSKWNEVFGEDVGNKEVDIEPQYEKGKMIKRPDGVEIQPTQHDVYVRFRIKEGTNRYAVDDRSLGFRWFFSFLLFTQFRIHRGNSKPTIFLFDEPASNLHATAQMKLLDSFPAIASSPHRLIYSTHSHYMVEPKWLEQAYIVYNAAMSEPHDVIAESITSDADVDIQAVPYRQFVHESPNKTSYFQPIIDTLEVVPSKFDYNTGGLVVEGKYDYYSIRLACQVLELNQPIVFPAVGSGTMGALVSMHRGWGLPVRVLFDSDKGGRDGRKRLSKEFNISPTEVRGISDFMDAKRMEELFSQKKTGMGRCVGE